MDLSLRQNTRQALAAYRSRHNGILSRKALFILLALCLGLLSLLALLDRAWLLPDSVRPWTSVVAYLLCAWLAWKWALSARHSASNQLGVAAGAEQTAPELHEKLLAAVELSQADPATVKDSPEFRAKLQDEVSEAVKSVDWKKRLPATPVYPWLKRLFLIALLACGLSAVPRLHFPGFLARAALPFANLERPSSVKIFIETPSGDKSLAPIASEVDVAVRIEGEAVDSAEIEYGELTSASRRMELAKIDGQRFEARVPVGQTDVRFRVRALDGISSWHLLQARARPRVVEFEKIIVPPAYSGLPELKSSEDHGDIEALEGSTVKLTMKCNQPVSEAAIVLNPDLPLHPDAPLVTREDGDSILRTSLTLDGKSEAWALNLTSTETGFTNEESASWRITLLPDLPPVVTMTAPAETQLSLLADDVVRFTGDASDDVGLAQVSLEHSVNGAKWTGKVLAEKPGKETKVTESLQLATLQLQAGDSVQTRLVATDLKGQRAESPVLRIIILDRTVDPQKRVWAAEQRRLAELSKELEERARDLTKDTSAIQKTIRKEKAGQVEPEAETQLARMKQQLERTREQADEVWEQLKKAAQAAPSPLDAEEVRQLGQRVAQLRNGSLKRMEEIAAKEPESETTDTLKKMASETSSAANSIRSAAEVFAADDTAQVAAQVSQLAARQQAQLRDQSLIANRDASQRAKWQEQQRAALAAQTAVKDDLDALKQQINGGQQNQINQSQKQIEEATRDLAESLDKDDPPQAANPPQSVTPQTKSPEHLYGAADNLAQRMQRNADAVKNIAQDAARRASEMRQRLQQMDNPALVALEQAQNDLKQAAADAKNPPKREKPSKDGLTDAQRAENKLREASKQLQDQAELREQNPMTNTAAALDANRASRAAAKLAEQASTANKDVGQLEKTQAEAQALAQATRTLEAEGLANEATRALDEAAARQSIAATQRASDEPQKAAEAAQQASEQLKQLPQALRRTPEGNADPKLQQTAQQAADQAKNASQQLAQNAQLQQQSNQPAPPPPANLGEAQTRAKEVADALAPRAKAARDQIAALAPKVSEMMKQVAQDLNQTKDKTQNAAQNAEAQKPVAEVADQARQIQPEAAENAEQMTALQAALRQEANAATLADENQRQLARTADVALEQMRQKSPQIAQNLRQATQAQASKPQAEALNNAAQAQKSTADALQQLAQAFGQMEAGQQVSQEQMQQLAQMEQQLGVQEPLDEAYNAAEELAKIAEAAGKNPEAALKALEDQLKRSAPMQRALAELASQAAKEAETSLSEKANQPSFLGDAAEAAGHELARVARHQSRLDQPEAAKKTAQASEQLNATAKSTKTQPANATPEAARSAQASAQEGAKSAELTAANAPDTSETPALQQAEARDLANALDQLDQMLHPLGGQQAQAQAGQQQSGQQQSGQQAQQSLANAQENQQQSMAQARAQGKVPGQSQQGQQGKQQPGKPNEDSPGQPNQEGGNFSQLVKAEDGTLVPIEVLMNGDWGKLPARMAEDLTEAARQEAAPEYRAAIENYYKAIAARAKK
ncbi:MAG: hypothetical protein JNJ83_20335 [Verrucomicrobiaceae bacterium]|nr:hypothetical protein [Verrucomicrobiaceae bacterium]